jgi:hypothetical protein
MKYDNKNTRFSNDEQCEQDSNRQRRDPRRQDKNRDRQRNQHREHSKYGNEEN